MYLGLNAISGYHSAITIYCNDVTIYYGLHLVHHPNWKAEKKFALPGIQTQDPDHDIVDRMTL